MNHQFILFISIYCTFHLSRLTSKWYFLWQILDVLSQKYACIWIIGHLFVFLLFVYFSSSDWKYDQIILPQPIFNYGICCKQSGFSISFKKVFPIWTRHHFLTKSLRAKKETKRIFSNCSDGFEISFGDYNVSWYGSELFEPSWRNGGAVSIYGLRCHSRTPRVRLIRETTVTCNQLSIQI